MSINNKIEANGDYSYAGGATFGWVQLSFKNNVVTGNENFNSGGQKDYGGGICAWYLVDGSSISNNIFSDNKTSGYGGAVMIAQTQNWHVIENNYFLNDSAKFGGAIWSSYSTLILQNNVFSGNQAGVSGGALFLDGSDNPIQHSSCIVNNSFSHNTAQMGGAISLNFVNPLIFNSIFWEDEAPSGAEIRGNCYLIEVAYSNIDTNLIYIPGNGLITGDGIMNYNPQFSDTVLLTLEVASECINMGIGEYTCHGNTRYAPLYDINGDARPLNDAFDMGAYEVLIDGYPKPVSSPSSMNQKNYPDPFKDYTWLTFDIARQSPVKVMIYDIRGNLLQTVCDDIMDPGKKVIKVQMAGYPAGIFFYRIQAGTMQATGKMVLMK
ncbi:MAG: hypothetical protein NT175_00230 [Bacteroidetes bacterium]|nr:hypothetical protein [Bacteroidota bacterium]